MSRTRVDVHLTEADLAAALRRDVADGLCGHPKVLPPKWFYDQRGSELFDEITRLPEYYPTRRERAILEAHAVDVARAGADTLIELGSGSSEKTRLLLDAMRPEGLRRYVPFDVSEAFLRDAAAAVADEYPDLEVHAVVGDFEHHLGTLPGGGRRLVALLGGTVGNLDPLERKAFLADLRTVLEADDLLLLGTDLVKDPARLVAAYDDAAGVTADFDRNVLRVVNRELGADFDVEAFAHEARWSPDDEWIEMHLRSDAGATVRVDALDLDVTFAPGETVRTEVSAKFREAGVRDELDAAGFAVEAFWTDRAGDFGLSLSRAV